MPAAALEAAARLAPVYPPPNAFAVAQDRLTEKSFLHELGVATPPLRPLHRPPSLSARSSSSSSQRC